MRNIASATAAASPLEPGSAGRRRRTALTAAALVVGNLFLHKPISDLCDALFARLGRAPYERIALAAVVAISLAGALLLRRRHGWPAALSRRRVLGMLAVLLAMAGAQRWLLVSNIELVHFPQFGLLAALLLVAGLGAQAAWGAATLAGVLDEAYQRLVIYPAVANVYFDWNDIVLNALGAALAVLLVGASGVRRPPRALVAAALAAVGAGAWLAPPNLAAVPHFPYRVPAFAPALTGRPYHVMTASEGLAALLAIAALLALALSAPTGGRLDPPNRNGSRDRRGIVLLLATLLLAGCVPRRPPPPPDAASTFITTFWCGPPPAELTDRRAAEIAAAGFTTIGAPCEGARDGTLNRRALDVAARHGLKVWITDPRVDQYHDLHPEWAERLDAAVAEYGGHPALDGYFLVDEPSADKFAQLAQVVGRLRRTDPRRVPYVNLLPDFVAPESFGTPTYREHVERYMATVRPPLLSFDYYPFRTDGDRPSYFDNLALIRAAALAHDVPFIAIVQAMPHGPYRDPTEAELAWQVYHALAFGARGISYFAYWTPVHVEGADRWQFRRGLVEDGRTTERFWQAARLNAAARAVAAELDDWRSLAVVDARGRFGTALPAGGLRGLEGDPVTVGLFAAGDGRVAALVVNQNYRETATAHLVLAPEAGPAARFDLAARRWEPLGEAAVTLPPGGAALLRW